MDDEHKHAMAKDILSSEIKKRLYLYSYIFLIVLTVVNLLLFIICLIVDGQEAASRAPSLVASYVGIAFAVINLFLIAILSALYFVESGERVSMMMARPALSSAPNKVLPSVTMRPVPT